MILTNMCVGECLRRLKNQTVDKIDGHINDSDLMVHGETVKWRSVCTAMHIISIVQQTMTITWGILRRVYFILSYVIYLQWYVKHLTWYSTYNQINRRSRGMQCISHTIIRTAQPISTCFLVITGKNDPRYLSLRNS